MSSTAVQAGPAVVRAGTVGYLAAWDEHRRAIATRWLDSFHLAPRDHDPAAPLAGPTP